MTRFVRENAKGTKTPKIITYESFHTWKLDTMLTSRINTRISPNEFCSPGVYNKLLRGHILNFCGKQIEFPFEAVSCWPLQKCKDGLKRSGVCWQHWPRFWNYTSRLKLPCPLSNRVVYNGETPTPVYAIDSWDIHRGRKADTNIRHHRNELGYCKRGRKMSNKWASVDKYDRNKIIRNDETENIYDGDQYVRWKEYHWWSRDNLEINMDEN